MKVLVIGSGGREHAICWKLSQSKSVEKIICLPGNPGIELENKCECHAEHIDYKTQKGRNRVIEIAESNDIDLTVVGPEEPLVYGIVDDFRKKGLKILGPDSNAARLEGSKHYAKNFMRKYGVRTPFSQIAVDYKIGCKLIEELSKFPVVIKADGLAAGKGVYICSTKEEALKAIDELMKKKKFGESGKKVLIEDFIDGDEISVLALTDSKVIKPLLSAKDHKRLLNGDKGPNTGGMGVVSPNPIMTKAVYTDFVESCLNPTLKGLKESRFDYRGVIFFGLIVKDHKCYLLEYNVRMGDPETQSILPLMSSDLMHHFQQTEGVQLEKADIKWNRGYCVNVVLASQGYPISYVKGSPIKGYDNPKMKSIGKVFFAGVGKRMDKALINTGGRVLSISSVGPDLENARQKAYKAMNIISMDGSYYRNDVGLLFF